MKYIVCLFALFFSIQSFATPRIKHVTIKKNTTVTLNIAPGLGTKFIFPFILDEEDTVVPFSLLSTNPAFITKREDGHNFFIAILDPKAGNGKFLGNIFANVAGYHITIELKTGYQNKKHYTDVIFDLSKEKRETLIQEGVRQRTKTLEKQYQDKLDALKNTSDNKAMALVGALAIGSSTSSNIKEEVTVKPDSGGNISVFVDNNINYGPFSMFVFEIENDSSGKTIFIRDVKLFQINKDSGDKFILDGAADYPESVVAKNTVKGVYTTYAKLIDPDNYLVLEVLTDKELIKVRW